MDVITIQLFWDHTRLTRKWPKWWYNVRKYAMNESPLGNNILYNMRLIFEKHGALLTRSYDNNGYPTYIIEFESEEHLTAFLLQWS